MSNEKRPEWMTSISSTVDPQDYLLGRKIDKTFELAQKEKADKEREARIELIAKDKIKLSHDPILDLERRKKQLKMDLIQNPVMMKQFRDKLLKGELDNKAGPSNSHSRPVSIKKGKVQIHGAKPEMPAFLQRMKEQIVEYENKERKERSEKRRRDHPSSRSSHPEDDDPTIVKLQDDDLTEAEYKRMKHELETHYKIGDGDKVNKKREELDIDQVIKSNSHTRHRHDEASSSRRDNRYSEPRRSSKDERHRRDDSKKDDSRRHKPSSSHTKKLSYGSSSEDD